MTTQEEAIDFYNNLTEGTERYKTLSLSARGDELDGFEMHVVPKEGIADVVNKLPDEMFEQANTEGIDVDDDVEAEDLEQEVDGNVGITKGTVEAFENLCMTSLNHQHLSKTQIADIIKNFDFEVLFELGSEILEFSIENSGDIQDFRVQN